MTHQKNFDGWNTQKKETHSKEYKVFVNEGEICYVNLGVNIGVEQDGKNDKYERPVVVIKKFGTNSFLAVPLTTTTKQGKFYYRFMSKKREMVAVLSQVRLLDTKRIERKIGYMSNHDLQELKQKIFKLIS